MRSEEAAAADTGTEGGPQAGSGGGAAAGGRSRAANPRGRRQGRATTRTGLLDAAERLWAEHGIHGASLDDIAAAAGLTKGAVYSNFTGKTDLLLAVLDRYTQAGLELCPLLRDPGLSVDERCRRAGERYARRSASADVRRLTVLLVEFWLQGMRDYAAGWRIADWFHARREDLATELRPVGISQDERATLAMAMDLGLAFQHLLDPDRVPARLYGEGMRLVLGTALPPRQAGASKAAAGEAAASHAAASRTAAVRE
jgi:AcrR family transcriptional regulator